MQFLSTIKIQRYKYKLSFAYFIKVGVLYLNYSKINLFSAIILVVLLSLIVSAINITNPQNIILNNTLNKTTQLAKLYNEDLLEFDKDYKTKYLNDNKNFSNINFKKIVNRDDSTFTVGARNDNIKGFEVDNQSYAVHLLYCISHKRYCTFRINGVPTKKLFSFQDFGNNKKHSFDLDENYILKINSVKFDYCDDRAFCHLGMEGYHVVNVSVEKK